MLEYEKEAVSLMLRRSPFSFIKAENFYYLQGQKGYPMRNIFLILLLFPLIVGCDATAEQAAEKTVEPENPDLYYQPKQSKVPGANGVGNINDPNIKPGDPLSPFNADGSLRPQFPDGVVERLNAIVMKSKIAIDKYDEIRPDIEKLVLQAKAAPDNAELDKKTMAAISEIKVLHGDAKSALGLLSDEGQKLVDSGRYYDEVIFSGMATFVSTVEDEFSDDIERFNKELSQ